jgi:hypothetical protein
MQRGWRGAVFCSAMAMALLGCAQGEQARSDNGTHAPRSLQVMTKGFVVAGPRGFCVDTLNSRSTEDSAFALMGSCSAISGNPADDKPKAPAILSASIVPADGPLDEAALDRLAAFLSSEDGMAALSRAEDDTDVAVIDLDRAPGMVLIHARDRMDAEDLQGDYWRAVFEVAGHIVSVTVSGFAATPFDNDAGKALARDFAAAMRRANGERGAGGGGLGTLLDRLL